ncbi:MAG TPA: magnesium chelatase domain-containing protein [Tepidisphaeraceae bacterium]|nr:magnesium chelatase domain-containing protein [Tepidisphaeraceae bacterium]
MLAKVQSFILIGIDPLQCEIEVDVSQRGLQKTVIVGLAQTAVKESIERVHRALINSGYAFPGHALLINLAPADVKKEGPALDLPMAIGVLRGTNFIKTDRHKSFLIAGELALDGRMRKIKGALSMALLAKQKRLTGVILPEENAREAAVVDGIEVYPVATLSQAVSFLNEQLPLEPHELNGEPYTASELAAAHDFAEVRGQEAVKRAITLAAAGAHNLLMVGPPGTGESVAPLPPHSHDPTGAVRCSAQSAQRCTGRRESMAPYYRIRASRRRRSDAPTILPKSAWNEDKARRAYVTRGGTP